MMPKVLKDYRETESFEDDRYERFGIEDSIVATLGACGIAALVCFGFMAFHFLGR